MKVSKKNLNLLIVWGGGCYINTYRFYIPFW